MPEQEQKPMSDVWTAKELADEAGVDSSLIRHYIKRGDIQAIKRAGTWFITADEARRWLQSRHK